jgi:hypothetical protein
MNGLLLEKKTSLHFEHEGAQYLLRNFQGHQKKIKNIPEVTEVHQNEQQ